MRDWNAIVRRRLAPLRLTADAEATLAGELASHLEDRYAELVSGGAAESDAFRTALAELEDVAALRRGIPKGQRIPRSEPPAAGESRRANVAAELARDLRYALRGMRRAPGFVLFVVVTLGLGIGCNTTVFTVINTLLLNPLPARDPATLAAVGGVDTKTGSQSSGVFAISYPDLTDYRARATTFQSLAGYTNVRTVTRQDNGASERLFAEMVTANYFDTLGLAPAAGRFFLPVDDGLESARPVVVMSYGSWQRRFGGAPGVIGSSVRLNRMEFTVIGVAPPGFIGVNAIFGPDFWIPAAFAEQLFPQETRHALADRSKTSFLAVGRLQPGVSRAQAQANVAAVAAALAREYAADENRSAAVRPLREALYAGTGTGSAQMEFAGAALIVVVGIVLLIACSNVANLLLARSAARRKEIAVRLAMGASRARLVRQLLTESLLLGLLSGLLGLALGYGGLAFLFGRLPGAANFVAPKFDAAVFLYTLALSLATGFLFGTVPALQVTRNAVAETLKEEGRTAGRSRRRVTFGNLLLVGQVALSLWLLVTAALFLRSIGAAYRMDPGFQVDHLAVFMTNPGQAGYDKPRTKAFYDDVRARVLRLPGVESVSWSSGLPLWSRSVPGLGIEGREERGRGDTVRAIVTTVDRDFFETSGIALLAGREFTAADGDHAAPVAIVNEKLARDYWPAGAIGRRITLPGESAARQVVGIARTANYTTWGEAPQASVYVPLGQSYSDAMTLYVRTRTDPAALEVAIDREIRAAGPEILAADRRTGREIVDGGLFQARMGVGLLTVFGVLALALASIGLYGILAYAVNQRKREIGLRMALGASPSRVRNLILGEGAMLVAAGLVIGAAASFWAGGLLSRMLYGVSPADPVSLGAAAAVLCAVALLACYAPARAATRLDPLEALREA